MKALIIPLSVAQLQSKRQRPLSKLMITKLLSAYVLERQGLFFGPKDIKGSITSLINRGLIIRKEIAVKGKNKIIWHVTYEAVEMLKSLGIDVVCVKPRLKKAQVISFLPLVEAYSSSRSLAKCLHL